MEFQKEVTREGTSQANNIKTFLKLMFMNIQSTEHKSSLIADEKTLTRPFTMTFHCIRHKETQQATYLASERLGFSIATLETTREWKLAFIILRKNYL